MIVFVVSWMVNIFLVPYMGLIGTIIISLLAQFGTRWFPSAMMGYYLLSTTKVSEFVLAMQRMHIPEAFTLSRFLLCSGSSLQFPKKRDLLETLCGNERNHGEKFFQESTSSIRISNCPSYDVCSNNRE